MYSTEEFETESDVEQKFIYKFLTDEEPHGLGYDSSEIKTKINIRKLYIDKGKKRALYYPDYAILIDGIPCVIVEAKMPNEDTQEAFRQARLYANEINATYKKGVNPCSIIIVTDGIDICAGYVDHDTPEVTVKVNELNPLDRDYNTLIKLCSRMALNESVESFRKKIKKESNYYKPVFMLGGRTIMNETVGENSFGSNISLEYKYLFNPEDSTDRKAIVENAYVKSKRKQSHVAPIDKLIKAAIPKSQLDAMCINDTSRPEELIKTFHDKKKIKNEICLLIGSVGSGKSTFTDYLKYIALPNSIKQQTEWININLNLAPISENKIYNWVMEQMYARIEELNPTLNFSSLKFQQDIFKNEIEELKLGAISLYPEGSEKYIDGIYNLITKLNDNLEYKLKKVIDYLYQNHNKLPIIVLDNCDKRIRDHQLLMFEVATWLKNTFYCMIFLPIRDTTYDQYCNLPPLDTVIKDLVFRIDPPLLQSVIYSRFKYCSRENSNISSKFTYTLSNNMRAECKREEVSLYIGAIINSLFQNQLFRRIITGLAGRNIRKGLEIILDFCKSGHISEDEIFKIRHSNGEYKLPQHLIAKILFKGNRKYYYDESSHIRNLFNSDSHDQLPDPFVRTSILYWLKSKHREYGPNRTKGYHKVKTLLTELQEMGHSNKCIHTNLDSLIDSNCVISESLTSITDVNELITITSSGFVHLDLLRNISYLSAVSEDVYFRENQIAKKIANNITGQGDFNKGSRQVELSNSRILTEYLNDYMDNYFIGSSHLLTDRENIIINIEELTNFVRMKAENDHEYNKVESYEKSYPSGTLIDGQVVSVQSYGIFVEFGLVTGLIHHRNYNGVAYDVIEDIEEGTMVKVEVIKYNNEHHKFDLKLIDII